MVSLPTPSGESSPATVDSYLLEFTPAEEALFAYEEVGSDLQLAHITLIDFADKEQVWKRDSAIVDLTYGFVGVNPIFLERKAQSISLNTDREFKAQLATLRMYDPARGEVLSAKDLGHVIDYAVSHEDVWVLEAELADYTIKPTEICNSCADMVFYINLVRLGKEDLSFMSRKKIGSRDVLIDPAQGIDISAVDEVDLFSANLGAIDNNAPGYSHLSGNELLLLGLHVSPDGQQIIVKDGRWFVTSIDELPEQTMYQDWENINIGHENLTLNSKSDTHVQWISNSLLYVHYGSQSRLVNLDDTSVATVLESDAKVLRLFPISDEYIGVVTESEIYALNTRFEYDERVVLSEAGVRQFNKEVSLLTQTHEDDVELPVVYLLDNQNRIFELSVEFDPELEASFKLL